jgi:hypothetical protein
MANGKKRMGTTTALTLAAGAAMTAAGAYWLYGAKDAAKHRKMARSFMLKARADVMDALEGVTDIDRTKYMAIVDKVVNKYSAAAGITAAEIAQMTKDLRAAWTHMNAARLTAKSVTGRGKSRPAPKAKSSTKKAAPKKAKR